MRTYAGCLASQPRHWAAVHEIIAGGHFGDDEPGTKPRGQPSEWCIGDAGHWREKNPVGDCNIAYFQWLKGRRFRTGHKFLVLLTGASSRLPELIFEHKCCAVKLHAYTLDSPRDLASALQQNVPFPQLLVCVSRVSMIWAVHKPTNQPESEVISSNAET
jgi:hypothetical protein